MKKLLFVAVAALTMTACSNESELVEATQQEIGFSAAKFNASRNTPAMGTDFNTDNKMVVTAVYTDAQKGASKYFEGVECAYDGTSVWKSGYLWPLEGTMQFGAYSTDATPDNVAWTYTAAKALETVTLDFTTTLLAGHEDVLYSDLTASVDCKKNALGVNPPVPVNFRHALAWLCVNLQTSDDAVNKVKVSDVRVNNVYLSGKALVEFGATSTVKWDPLAGNANTSIDASAAPAILNATETPWSTGLLVPTQNKTSITIEYSVKNGANWTSDMTYTIALDAAEKWIAGHRYNYNITIGLNEITFTGSVTNFDVENSPITL